MQLSFDGGANWSAAIALPTAAPVTALAFTGAQTLWAATLGRGVWALSLPETNLLVSLQPLPPQTTAGTSLTLAAVVTTLGTPMAGMAVAFTAAQGGSTRAIATATTDSNGLAEVSFSPQQAGALTVEAAAGGQASAQSETAVAAAAAARIKLLSGGNQAQQVGTRLSAPMVLEVDDAFGNAVAGTPVTLTTSAGALSLSQGTTNAQGQLSVGLVLPNTAGTIQLLAETPGLPALTWLEQAQPVPDFSLALSAPVQPAPPGQLIHVTVGVTAIGAFDQPVALQCVEPQTGCTLQPASILPGQTAVVTAEAAANSPALPIEVTGNGSHAAQVTVPLQALQLSSQAAALNLGPSDGAASTMLTLTSINGLSGSAHFSATQADGSPLPSGVAAALQPAVLQLAAGGSPQVQLAVTVAEAAATPPFAGLPWSGWEAGLLLLLLLGAAASPRRRRRRCRLATVALLALAAAACGGAPASTPPPPPPTPQTSVYNIQVTASLAGLQASVPITVTVTRQ